MITLVNGNSNSQEPTNSPKREKRHFYFFIFAKEKKSYLLHNKEQPRFSNSWVLTKPWTK